MNLVKKFIVVHLLWAAGIMACLLPVALLSITPLEPVQYLRWLAHSVALAMFPAGLIVGPAVFRGRVLRNIALLTIVEAAIMVIVFALLGFAAPMDGTNFVAVMQDINVTPTSWLQWNQQAWTVYMTLAETISVPVYAGLGMMLGAWAEHVLPVTFRRILFWAMSLKMVGFTYLITENSYEMLVIKTNGPVAFSAFLMLLIPLGMYGGLILPSIFLAKRAQTL